MASHPHTIPKTAPTVAAPKPERAHPRLRLPGSIELGGQRFKLFDVSLGGFCFEGGGASPRAGETHRGNLALNVDGVAVSLNVPFQVRNHDPRTHRTGCQFDGLGQAETLALRNVINAQIAGEAVTAADLNPGQLHHGAAAARPTPAVQVATRPVHAPPRSSHSRFRAVATTALFLGAAIVAFGYTARQLNRVVFASTATAAKVAGPTYQVVMPREGTFYSLVPEDGVVKKGAPIGSFEAPVLDLVRSQTLSANTTPEQLQKLMKVTVKGTITSPCDCKVQQQFVTDGQYVAREQQLFELMPRDFQPYLVARFRNDQLADISTGDRVSFKVAGDSQSRAGRISQVRAHGRGDTVDTDVMVMITPEEPLPPELLARPAEVIAGGFMLPDVVAGGTATAKEKTN